MTPLALSVENNRKHAIHYGGYEFDDATETKDILYVFDGIGYWLSINNGFAILLDRDKNHIENDYILDILVNEYCLENCDIQAI